MAGGKPAIVAVWMITSWSSSAVRPASSEERRWTGSWDERPVATRAATEAIWRSRNESPGREYTSPYATSMMSSPRSPSDWIVANERSPWTSRSLSRPRSRAVGSVMIPPRFGVAGRYRLRTS